MIHLNAGKVGRVAAADMFERLAGGDVAHDRLIENGTWVERASTGPAPSDRTPRRQVRQVTASGRRARQA
jgi:hypothetical protein